uniref:Neural proliferation differentiation and control protein 1-like n=1 Tax=Rhabditophanes sp. KR3021 TaxID=114890 RepID=A0AC35TNT9_9BILA
MTRNFLFVATFCLVLFLAEGDLLGGRGKDNYNEESQDPFRQRFLTQNSDNSDNYYDVDLVNRYEQANPSYEDFVKSVKGQAPQYIPAYDDKFENEAPHYQQIPDQKNEYDLNDVEEKIYSDEHTPHSVYKDQRLSEIVNKLSELSPEFVPIIGEGSHHSQSNINEDSNKIPHKNIINIKSKEEVREDSQNNLNAAEPVPVKKGQNEFVEFIEPSISKAQKSIQKFELGDGLERSSGGRASSGMFSNMSIVVGVLAMALIAVVVVGTVSAGSYLRKSYGSQHADFSDFTRYSPGGPGRDKKGKKYMNGHGIEAGDEKLAYKAQLQHYQQAKQKIIYGDDVVGAVIPGVDCEEHSDDETDVENNYSVYECPGLAPTGDIQITNPNFDSAR